MADAAKHDGNLLAVAAVVPIVLAQLGTVPCNDVWWHLASARIMVQQGAIPSADPFTFTSPGMPYVNQPWAAQLMIYGVFRVGGPALLLFANALFVGFAYALLARLAWRRSQNARVAAWTLILVGVVLGADNWSVRPQTLVLPLFISMLAIVSRTFGFTGADDAPASASFASWTKDTGAWALPLLAFAWVNLHGSFALALVIPAVALFGAAAQQTLGLRFPRVRPATQIPLIWAAIWLAISAGTSMLNPRGFGVYRYVASLVFTKANEWNAEYLPPETWSLAGVGLFAVVAALLVLMRASARRLSWSELAVLLFLLTQALLARRAILWLALAVTPTLTLLASGLRTRNREPKVSLHFAVPLLIVLVAAVMGTSPWVRARYFPSSRAGLLEDITPVAAVANLLADPHPPSRLFNDMQYGCFLEWAAPTSKVFIDTRFEFNPHDILRDYVEISGGSLSRLDDRSLDGVLLNKESQAALADALVHSPAWEIRYDDAISMYAVRRSTH